MNFHQCMAQKGRSATTVGVTSLLSCSTLRLVRPNPGDLLFLLWSVSYNTAWAHRFQSTRACTQVDQGCDPHRWDMQHNADCQKAQQKTILSLQSMAEPRSTSSAMQLMHVKDKKRFWGSQWADMLELCACIRAIKNKVFQQVHRAPANQTATGLKISYEKCSCHSNKPAVLFGTRSTEYHATSARMEVRNWEEPDWLMSQLLWVPWVMARESWWQLQHCFRTNNGCVLAAKHKGGGWEAKSTRLVKWGHLCAMLRVSLASKHWRTWELTGRNLLIKTGIDSAHLFPITR